MKYVYLLAILALNAINCSASCDTVYNLKASRGVTDSFTIHVGWDPNANAIGYQAFIGTKNAIPKSNGSSFLTTDSLILNSAMPDSTYTICVRSICGAGDTSGWICRSITMPSNPTTHVSQFSLNNNAIVYPNPATDRISFKLPESIMTASMSILDIRGQIQLTQQIKGGCSINVNTLAKGFYIIIIQSDQYRKVEKLLVE